MPRTIAGTIDLPLEQAATKLREAAGAMGYSLAEGTSSADALVLRKGISLVSWGSGLTVRLTAASPTVTSIEVTTKETFAVTDWGRGKRAAQKLLAAAGGRIG
jgi:hypothetical protein